MLPSENFHLVSVEEKTPFLACIHLWASSSTARALPAICKFGQDCALSISTLSVSDIKAEQAFKERAGGRAFLQSPSRVWSLPPSIQPTHSAGGSLKNFISQHIGKNLYWGARRIYNIYSSCDWERGRQKENRKRRNVINLCHLKVVLVGHTFALCKTVLHGQALRALACPCKWTKTSTKQHCAPLYNIVWSQLKPVFEREKNSQRKHLLGWSLSKLGET